MPSDQVSAEPTKFRVVHPSPGRHMTLGGVAFERSYLMTDDAALAKSLTEFGCQIYVGQSEVHALGTQSPSEQKRIAAAKVWAFPPL